MLELAKIIQFKECLMPLYTHMIQIVLDAGFNYDTAKFCMQWGKDFLVPMNGGQEPEYIDKEAWGDYWTWAYRIGGRLIIVSEHPQGKPKRLMPRQSSN